MCYVRNPPAFSRHLCRVASRAERVALQLQRLVPEHSAPDPAVAFVAGAWHDAGKICYGDDYHEITSALELVDYGVEWRLVRAADDADARALLLRAARAVLSGFALYEQWQGDYQPANADRQTIEPMFDRLCKAIQAPAPVTSSSSWLLLPATLDALIVMYADMMDGCGRHSNSVSFAHAFDSRWRAIERASLHDDPPLHAILPRVRRRVRDGCALVDRFLNDGYDEAALVAFRAAHFPSDVVASSR